MANSKSRGAYSSTAKECYCCVCARSTIFNVYIFVWVALSTLQQFPLIYYTAVSTVEQSTPSRQEGNFLSQWKQEKLRTMALWYNVNDGCISPLYILFFHLLLLVAWNAYVVWLMVSFWRRQKRRQLAQGYHRPIRSHAQSRSCLVVSLTMPVLSHSAFPDGRKTCSGLSAFL